MTDHELAVIAVVLAMICLAIAAGDWLRGKGWLK